MSEDVLPWFCDVVELDEPRPNPVIEGGAPIRWTFACHSPRCEGRDMSRSGVGWLVAQAITAAELHANACHQIDMGWRCTAWAVKRWDAYGQTPQVYSLTHHCTLDESCPWTLKQCPINPANFLDEAKHMQQLHRKWHEARAAEQASEPVQAALW